MVVCTDMATLSWQNVQYFIKGVLGADITLLAARLVDGGSDTERGNLFAFTCFLLQRTKAHTHTHTHA